MYQQAQRWMKAGCFETLANDLRAVLRLAAGRDVEPSAAILDSRTLRSTPESGGNSIELAYVDQGYTGERAASAAQARHITLEVVKLPDAKKGFVLLPRRWVVERSFAWATRFRRLVKDYERYASTLANMHRIAFVCLMLNQAAKLMTVHNSL